MKRIDTRQRLSARLVCKAFACLGPDDSLTVAVDRFTSNYVSRMHSAAMLMSASTPGPILDFNELLGKGTDRQPLRWHVSTAS